MNLILPMSMMALLSLIGCANQPPKDLSEGPTMREVLNQHIGGGGALNGPIRRLGRPDTYNMSGYTRTAANETRNLFARLPNPDLCFYVYPHLSQEGLPVPGYSSCIPMYETTHYALPGEIGTQPLLSRPPGGVRYQDKRETEQSLLDY
ncbi:MAG: TIGR03751 family conjugal transfer lipoprotein [Candidatus Thiodiazotropha sp. 6PLUC2]|uniref:TIGR03751 family conjugal transfer lipoprotein n=1 Tax=Candidatus Thiodiazotropha lotti TaxID=2792787 RepID=A0A9E4K203_9GAMM|nr:TIGR03751 family conjugal transfer lipoprotein [Candidatus Thiodiazotropha weberae]MCG7933003.1 TIGR03751 family conjugal transfer lipoprotein [Candidatus Thiodiazotropha lotti]MCG7937539.1 TIGR03751 family conjugal transfer lipoprotein [Candidatus Thiodiazotropha lotti]MCW4202005.1 TIGR03751 family conjugal transfer lipoprotein [Candidatus Thiodiazotropha lotti]MCW4222856.1 TIGR03751 family conjugal transfer lipoprotein [Candidatus Thiodiazotropha lotti]